MKRVFGLVYVGTAALLAIHCGGSTPPGGAPGLFDAGPSGAPDGSVGASGSSGSTGSSGGITLNDSGPGPCTGAGCDDATIPDGGPESFCGDGKITFGESCDDGNSASGDGCSEVCRVEADSVCPEEGKPCKSTVVCGDGKISGREECDDGNARASDGCSADCKLEAGWKCPFVGVRCVAAECGDGLVVGFEECDDKNTTPKDGCSETCRLEDGWKCETPGAPCAETKCGDGKPEGTEQCDDGNFDLGDGCSPLCRREPDCSQGACVSKCGDGIVLGDEACDDGNLRDGDGCSAECKVELGFKCTQPPLAVRLEIPIVFRDFSARASTPSTTGTPPDYSQPNHVDFQLVSGEPDGVENGSGTNARIVRSGQGSTDTGRGKDLGLPGETFEIQHLDGSKIANVSLAGKPVYAASRATCDRTALPSSANTWAKCTKTTMDGDSFQSWYVDRDAEGKPVTWPNFMARGETLLKKLTLLRGSFGADGVFVPGGDAYTFDSRYMLIDGSMPTPPNNPDGLGFFPLDELGTSGTACNDGKQHNFHFTSEVRFWFAYDAATSPRLDFSGDDDVWVYVNGHLALDIGGIHNRRADGFVIDATNAAAWGLEDKKVYEIAVFQAERNTCASNYWLTLRGFNAARSECASLCGDGVLASDELCDDGDKNHPTEPVPYGKCGPTCRTRGPFCGDGAWQQEFEQCDNGVNLSVYNFDGSGCAPGCKKPPSCGDGTIQGAFEKCDDGEKNDDTKYGGCTTKCVLGPRCGDGKIDPTEACDDGPGGSASCSPSCVSRVLR